MGQLTFDLGHRPAFGRDDLLVAPGNSEAVAWVDRWPAWPAHALAIFGPPGCGKSHLAQVFALRADARVLDAAALENAHVAQLIEAHRCFVVEDGESLKDERALLHLLNTVKERGGHVLLTSRIPPARWAVVLPDLKSRVAAVQAVGIAVPDDATMEAVLVKLFADRQIAVEPDVIAFLVRRIDRTFASARDVVTRADQAALVGKRAPTIPLLKQVLDG